MREPGCPISRRYEPLREFVTNMHGDFYLDREIPEPELQYMQKTSIVMQVTWI